MPKRRTFLAAAAALAAIATTPAFALGSLVDLELVDRGRHNELLAVHQHRGAAWVAGRPGDRYAVRLTNRSGARVLVVLSVDGVNAVSGETAATDQTGYVLGPWQTSEISGWRKSLTEAAAFYFTALPDSYAARTDRPDNVGVIGAAVFRERERVAVAQPSLRADAADAADAGGEPERRARVAESAAPGALAGATPPPAPASPSTVAPSADAAKSSIGALQRAPRDERLGTGHGERLYAPTTQTTFERASSRPAEVVRLRYDSAANLIASGVIARPQPARPVRPMPDPFPSAFVPDPKG